jgi:hypothetical protein
MSLVRIYSRSDTVSPLASLYGDAGDHEMILCLLDGWLGGTDSSVDLSERDHGNGAHDVPETDLDYGVRTVSVDYRILADSRSRLLRLNAGLRALAGRIVRIRVTDDVSDLYAMGYLSGFSVDKAVQNPERQTSTGTLTFICVRPELLSWQAYQAQLFAARVLPGGLSYGDSGKGLEYPSSYGGLGGAGDTGMLVNGGSYDAYPVITVNGPFPDGLLLVHDGGSLEYQGSVSAGTPLTLDCDPRSQSASMGGVDVSRNLIRRDFPMVPRMGSTAIRLLSAGSGWVTCTWHDTYL